jgi:hypothetical protein
VTLLQGRNKFKPGHKFKMPYFGHTGKEAAKKIAAGFGIDQYPIVQHYIDTITDELPRPAKRARLTNGSTGTRAIMPTVSKTTVTRRYTGRKGYRSVKRSMGGKKRFTRRYTRSRRFGRKNRRNGVRFTGYQAPTVMNIAESKRVETPMSNIPLNNIETIYPVTMPINALNVPTLDQFGGKRCYLTGLKIWFSLVNQNPNKDKYITVKVLELDANENIADLAIYRNLAFEEENSLAQLPLIERGNAKLGYHQTAKLIYSKNVALSNVNLNNPGKEYRHWKVYIPLMKIAKIDVGEDNTAQILNKRYAIRIGVWNLDATTTPDALGQNVLTDKSKCVLYFKDI